MATDTSTEPRHAAERDAPAARRLSAWLKGYRPLPGVPDELFDEHGRPRDRWIAVLGEFAAHAEGAFGLATRHLRDTGASHRVYGEDHEQSWPIDPLPLILDQAEWDQITAGVTQRANLIEAVLQDIYGEGKLVAEGALPAAALAGSPDFLRSMVGAKPAGGRYMQLYAADLGRGPDGRWWVLDDRTQAPSGAGYALQNRLVVSRAYPALYNNMNVHRVAPFFDAFRKGLSEAGDRSDPRICLLTPGPFSQTYFEQAHLARYLGFLLVEGDDLVARDGKVYVRTIAGLKRADVILRRVDADFLDPLELNTSSRLGTPGMLEAIREGGVAVMNMPGSGVMESRALLGFLPQLARRLLGEELKLPNVATWWCGQPRERDLVESTLDDLIIAPAFNTPNPDGGFAGPRLVADMSPDERAAFMRKFADRPGDFVGQDVVRLSTMPVLRDGKLEPAPFVLRVFAAATPDGIKILPGGFCRMSDRTDVRAISMGEGARTADVWVVDEKPVERLTLIPSRDDVKVRRILGHLPSRAADNLFWLGRYIERAEATLRLVRSLCTSLMASEAAVHASGETFDTLRRLLVEWGALDEKTMASSVLEAARASLHDEAAWGSVISLVRSAKRTASGMRERLSADFWALLLELEADLGGARDPGLRGRGAAAGRGRPAESGRPVRPVAGEHEPGRRLALPRHGPAHRAGREHLPLHPHPGARRGDAGRPGPAAGPGRQPDHLSRPLPRGPGADPGARPGDAGSVQHPLARLPADHAQGSPLGPADPAGRRHAGGAQPHPAAAGHRGGDRGRPPSWTPTRPAAANSALMRLSGAIADRFFLQGANAVPTVKLVGLA